MGKGAPRVLPTSLPGTTGGSGPEDRSWSVSSACGPASWGPGLPGCGRGGVACPHCRSDTRQSDLFLTLRNLSQSTRKKRRSLTPPLALTTSCMHASQTPKGGGLVRWPGCPVAGGGFQKVKLRQLETSVVDQNLRFCLPFFWGLAPTSCVLLVNSVPTLVPVNQQALLSNIAAFVTFLCIHNIEALKQA